MNPAAHLAAAVMMAVLGMLAWLLGDHFLMNYTPRGQAGFERIADVAYGGISTGFAVADINRWSVPAGFELLPLSDRPGQASLTAASGQNGLSGELDWEEQGVVWPLAQEYAHVFNGQRLRIRIEARAAMLGPAPVELAVLFTSRQAGDSGWQVLELSEQFQTYSFEFRTPELMQVEEVSPFLVLRPAGTGPENAVIVREAAVSLVPGDV